MRSVLNNLARPFRSESGSSLPLVGVFVLINSIVLINACLHDPRIGYDAPDHLKYIEALAQLRLVTPDDSRQFFAAPLPYMLPALLVAVADLDVFWAAKAAQFINVFLSLGLTWFLIRACHLISPRSSLKFTALVFLALFPVYYKTFAFVRGEPYITFFAVMILYFTLSMTVRERFDSTSAIALGCAMGLCGLSRQWGVLVLIAVFLFLFYRWLRSPGQRKAIAKVIFLCAVCVLVITAWFYIYLQVHHGSMRGIQPTTRRGVLIEQPTQGVLLRVRRGSVVHEPDQAQLPQSICADILLGDLGRLLGLLHSVWGRHQETPVGLRSAD